MTILRDFERRLGGLVEGLFSKTFRSGLQPVELAKRLLREMDVDAPVVVGGIIPDADRARLEADGVARVYTPKDFRLSGIVADLAELAIEHRKGRLVTTG